MGGREWRMEEAHAGRVFDSIRYRGEFSGLANLSDDAVLGVKSSAFQFALGVHGDKDISILDEQCGHLGVRALPSSAPCLAW